MSPVTAANKGKGKRKGSDDYGASSSKKRKGEDAKPSESEEQGANNSSASPAGAWSKEEMLALYGAMHRLCLSNVSMIRQDADLQRQSGHVVLKMRREFKETEIDLGGDGKWLDDFKLTSSKKSS